MALPAGRTARSPHGIRACRWKRRSRRSAPGTPSAGCQAGDWAGLTAIEVDPRFRRQGLGTAITKALAIAAAKRAVSSIYLQVTDGNAGARALRRQLGFTDHHGYHYRVAPA
ncbi:MAG TPA: GNAT family N-acetyltransferase [Streptosporangiaceae bacterium]|nr:GNAT family N-acetyltransferase [Streptosporangiaceae bacterium]